jgi:DNA-binding MarR family transcriptional regulator
MIKPEQIRALISRLARLDAAETWEDALNPTQVAALEYLTRANRFSRAPSHVADYLGTTRGTMSQTLKSLERKGYVIERRSEKDRRSISYDPTEGGRILAARRHSLVDAVSALPDAARIHLGDSLAALLECQLQANGGRPFGICRTCAHYRTTRDGSYCALLSLPLLPEETDQICHEHVMPA